MNYPIFASGVVFGLLISIGVVGFLKRRRILELFSDPYYYKIFSSKRRAERKIYRFLEENKRINISKASSLVGISEASAKECLENMKKDFLLERSGKGLKSLYFIKK